MKIISKYILDKVIPILLTAIISGITTVYVMITIIKIDNGINVGRLDNQEKNMEEINSRLTHREDEDNRLRKNISDLTVSIAALTQTIISLKELNDEVNDNNKSDHDRYDRKLEELQKELNRIIYTSVNIGVEPTRDASTWPFVKKNGKDLDNIDMILLSVKDIISNISQDVVKYTPYKGSIYEYSIN